MSLPDLIEIVPLDKPVRAEITVPGSKSITNRALILAALAEGEVTLEGALWSEDTQIMVECLQELGFMVDVRPDPNEFCNRTITVYGKGGEIPPGGTERTAAGIVRRQRRNRRAISGGVRLPGQRRLPIARRAADERAPEGGVVPGLARTGLSRRFPDTRQIAARSFTAAARNPARKCTVNIEESSQFASALLLCAKVGGWNVEVVGENAEESPYVAMTSKLIEAFPKHGGKFQIEPDARSGSYFWAAGWLLADLLESESTDILLAFTSTNRLSGQT